MGATNILSNGNYDFLKKRVLELGDLTLLILRHLKDKDDGLYFEEILKIAKCSEIRLRPILTGIYTAGFIDREQKGNMKIYKINDNGIKLINEQ